MKLHFFIASGCIVLFSGLIFLSRNLFFHSSKRSGNKRRQVPINRYEIALTILVILGIGVASLIVIINYSVPPRLCIWCFLIFVGAYLFIGKQFGKDSSGFGSHSESETLASVNLELNVKMRNNAAGKVIVTLQWPNRKENAYIHQQLSLRTGAATAEYFSELTEIPTYSAVRSHIEKSIKAEARILRLSLVEVMIQGIDIREPQPGEAGIIIGLINR